MLTKTALPLILFSFLTTWSPHFTQAQDKFIDRSNNPVEIGLVNWNRDLDAALAQSDSSGKPAFVLFQEVPGCSGCQKFGREVLSHPLIVEAIEDEFIPVVVFNNRSSGPDKQLLDRFRERAWNYQVIRFLDSSGKDIVVRKEGIWSVGAVAYRMIETLKKQNRPIPKYLQTLVSVNNQSSHATAAFAMHCFWTGEYRLGGIEGVVATEAGWLDGREVTLVKYNKNAINIESLASQAAQVRCADKIYTPTGGSLAGLKGGKLDRSYRSASASDQKRQISRFPQFAKLPGINAMQLTKINSAAPDDEQLALSWLSPRQRQSLQATR